MRIAIGLEYDGSHYNGWQRQADVISIQQTVEEALSHVAEETITTICAGRTDKGVHAIAQVLHFDTTAKRQNHAWVMGTNSHLPPSVRVLWAKPVSDTFNARRSATSRRYRYLLLSDRIRPSLLRTQVGWTYQKLNLETMREAAIHWIGEHDFSSFRAASCQSVSPIRLVTDVHLHQKDNLFIIDIEANAFLHHMVRNMVGVLMKIGAGKRGPLWAKDVLEARDRKAAAATAPASGLYLVNVRYPEEYNIPKIKLPWFLYPDDKGGHGGPPLPIDV